MSPGPRADDTLTVTGFAADMPLFSTQESGAQLLCIDGPGAGAIQPVDTVPIIVGSSQTCDLRLNDSRVSRRHLQATYVTGGDGIVELVDLNSKNGCYRDGERFERCEVNFGAEFSVGRSTFKVVPAHRELAPAEADTSSYGGLIGGSSQMRRLFTIIEQVAAAQVSVLIEGETGVGKELVAEEIHRRSSRRDKPFVVFDCGAIPSELIESALFGHVRGAFTGATNHRDGLFDEADGGTVFLDEIGELRLDLQPSLLRVLDRGMVRRVGEAKFHKVDVRVVAATHRSLPQMIEQHEFREDLYYRLAVVRLSVPPLRERAEDIELLARHFLRRVGRADLRFEAKELRCLQEQGWSGNVRELRNVVERAVALSVDGKLSIEDYGCDQPASASTPAAAAAIAKSGPRLPFREAKARVLEAFERDYLVDLMAEFGSQTQAAKAAEMDRKHLRVLLQRHGIELD